MKFHIVHRFAHGLAPHEPALDNIRLVAEKVMPRFR
jgi:hypothetical protein